METIKCASCGELVLSTEKFCKNCGKPIEQKKENDAPKECISCGTQVLPTEKFCKNCGKPTEQENKDNVTVENPNKKFMLTFDALNQGLGNVLYSIEVDGNYLGKIKPGEKIDTFVTKGKHNVVLKRNQDFRKSEFEILVESNQSIFLKVNQLHLGKIEYSVLDTNNETDALKRQIEKKELKVSWRWWLVGLIVLIIVLFIRFGLID